MKKRSRLFAVLSAAAMSLSMLTAMPASAEEPPVIHTVTFNWTGYSEDAPLKFDVEEGVSMQLAVQNSNYDNLRFFYPAPKDGKQVVSWHTLEVGAPDFDFETTDINGDMDLYPTVKNTTPLGDITLTLEEGLLPSLGQPVPSEADLKDSLMFPSGSPYTVQNAYYTTSGEFKTNDTTFENDKVYTLYVVLAPTEGTYFDYITDIVGNSVPNYSSASLNGEAANLGGSFTHGDNALAFTANFTIGTPATVKVTLHGDTEQSFNIPKDGNYLDNGDKFIDMKTLVPTKEGAVFFGWCDNPELTGRTVSVNSLRSDAGDYDLYPKWAKVIDTVKFTTNLPLCGTEVDYVDPSDDYFVEIGNSDTDNSVRSKLTDSPNVTVDTEGTLYFDGYWGADLTDPTAGTTVTIGYGVEGYIGTIKGEHTYEFLVNLRADQSGSVPYVFAENVAVYGNGTRAAAMSFRTYDRPYTITAPGTGDVGGLQILTKGASSISVIGTVTADHNWDSGHITTDPGCDTKGVKTYSCKSGDATQNVELDPHGHTWLEWKTITPATETTWGLEQRECSYDGMHKETRKIPPIGSNEQPVIVPSTDPQTGAGAAVTAAIAALAVLALILLKKKH